MSMYGLFKTNTDAEQTGVIIDYGTFRVTIARAGGANKRYSKVLETKTRPYRRALETDTMSEERGIGILHEVYAETVVLNWEVQTDTVKNTWKQGIESPTGDILPYTTENVIKTFGMLPDLFLDIQAQAQKIAMFREVNYKAAEGN